MKTYYTEYPKGQFKAASDEEAIKNNALVVYRESEVETEKDFVVLKKPECYLRDCEKPIQLSSGKIVGTYNDKFVVSHAEYEKHYTVNEMDTDPMTQVTDWNQVKEYLHLTYTSERSFMMHILKTRFN